MHAHERSTQEPGVGAHPGPVVIDIGYLGDGNHQIVILPDLVIVKDIETRHTNDHIFYLHVYTHRGKAVYRETFYQELEQCDPDELAQRLEAVVEKISADPLAFLTEHCL